MKKTSGIIMIFIGVFILVAAASAAFSVPESSDKLKNAAFIDDGQLHPEHDGELVVVCGKLSGVSSVYDEALYLTLPGCCAARYVETLELIQDSDDEYHFEWRTVGRESDEWLKDSKIVGDVSLCGYKVSGDLMSMLTAGLSIPLSMFDNKELVALENSGIYLVEFSGDVYFSEVSSAFFEDMVLQDTYSSDDEELGAAGARRVHYRYLDASGMQMAVAGIQQGDTIVRDQTLDIRPVFENADSKDDIMKDTKTFGFIGLLIGFVAAAALIFFGVRRMRY